MTTCDSAPDDQLAVAIEALRAQYLAEAPTRIAELWTEFARVQNGDAHALPALRTLAHRLAGSGGSYGLPDVTTCGRAMDQFCRAVGGALPSSPQVADLRLLIQRIADAFHEASSPE